MYDANLGRFLSPDNNIQEPFNTQSFNRYGYVLNNPLSYSDPSGEFFFLAVIIGAVIGGISAAAKEGANFGDILLGTLIGAASGLVGAGVGSVVAGGAFFGSAVATTTGFFSGFLSGAAGGFAGGFVGGAATAWANGANFGQGLGVGLKVGAISGATAGLMQGTISGFQAMNQNRNFWSGKLNEVGSENIVTGGRVKYKFLDEKIPKGKCPTGNCEIAKTSTNPKYGDYGNTRNGGLKAHRGLDFVGKEGDPVYAMHDGIVDNIGGSKALGPYRVRIKVTLSGKNYYNNYGHLSKNLVNIGDKIVTGNKIGIMGRLGNLARTTFPTHVHVSFHRITSYSPLTLGYVYPSYTIPITK